MRSPPDVVLRDFKALRAKVAEAGRTFLQIAAHKDITPEMVADAAARYKGCVETGNAITASLRAIFPRDARTWAKQYPWNEGEGS